MTQKEKALRIIVNQIKEFDKNALTLDVLDSREKIQQSRKILFDIIGENGYEITICYKLFKIEKQM